MRRGLIGLCLLAMATAGCATNAHPAAPTVQLAVERSLPVVLQSRPLDLLLLAPLGSPAATAAGSAPPSGCSIASARRGTTPPDSVRERS